MCPQVGQAVTDMPYSLSRLSLSDVVYLPMLSLQCLFSDAFSPIPFLQCRQEDAQEFLSFLLDQMHEELNRLALRGGPGSLSPAAPPSGQSSGGDEAAGSWETVGRKNKSSVTREHSFQPSDISDIFFGKLHSEVKVRGTQLLLGCCYL